MKPNPLGFGPPAVLQLQLPEAPKLLLLRLVAPAAAPVPPPAPAPPAPKPPVPPVPIAPPVPPVPVAPPALLPAAPAAPPVPVAPPAPPAEPPHCEPQLFETHVVKAAASALELQLAGGLAEVTHEVQVASFEQACASLQQLFSKHVWQVAFADENPHFIPHCAEHLPL
jgi:hypothetical protein